MNLDSIASVLDNSSLTNVETKDNDKSEEESTVENKKEIEEKVEDSPQKKPVKIECENEEYKDPVSDDYKIEFNNRMGNNTWKKDSDKADLVIWNTF